MASSPYATGGKGIGSSIIGGSAAYGKAHTPANALNIPMPTAKPAATAEGVSQVAQQHQPQPTPGVPTNMHLMPAYAQGSVQTPAVPSYAGQPGVLKMGSVQYALLEVTLDRARASLRKTADNQAGAVLNGPMPDATPGTPTAATPMSGGANAMTPPAAMQGAEPVDPRVAAATQELLAAADTAGADAGMPSKLPVKIVRKNTSCPPLSRSHWQVQERLVWVQPHTVPASS